MEVPFNIVVALVSVDKGQLLAQVDHIAPQIAHVFPLVHLLTLAELAAPLHTSHPKTDPPSFAQCLNPTASAPKTRAPSALCTAFVRMRWFPPTDRLLLAPDWCEALAKAQGVRAVKKHLYGVAFWFRSALI